MKQLILLTILTITVCLPATDAATADPEYDLLILNGRVLDGTGNPWYRADIAVRGDRIAAVGDLSGSTAYRMIDAEGLYIAPGFIDVHSHSASGLTDPDLSSAIPLLAQGITTVIVNPDGGGPIDLNQQSEELLEHGLGVNVARFIGHGAIRRAVLDMSDREPVSEELERMREMVRQGMEDGAVGLSSGLFYAPASFATTEEVIAMARVAARYNGVYQSHIRDESDYSIGLREAVSEVIRISREAGLPGVVTHIKALGPNVWGLSEEIIAMIEQARHDGVEVFADQYPYEASSTGLSAALLPRWATEGGRQRFLERLEEPDTVDRILEEMKINLARRGGAERISIRRVEARPEFNGMNLREIADELDLPATEAALQLLREGSPGIVSFNMNEKDIRRFMQQNWTMTSSDGGLVAMGEGTPHPRSYGSFPRKIRHYVLDEAYIDLPSAIRSMTSLSAVVHRIPDRGLVRPGKIADLVLFDLDSVHDNATYTDPHHLSEGFLYVLVNGEIVVDERDFTKSLPGRVLGRREAPTSPELQ